LIPNDSTPNWLDGQHTVFGEVTSGCDHVTAISGVTTGNTDSNDQTTGDQPIQDVKLVSATFVGSETKPWYEFW
jgi:cyclophilin family peptidyl-prolyl cis-trans isomerase